MSLKIYGNGVSQQGQLPSRLTGEPYRKLDDFVISERQVGFYADTMFDPRNHVATEEIYVVEIVGIATNEHVGAVLAATNKDSSSRSTF
jgi:hypothetical protein